MVPEAAGRDLAFTIDLDAALWLALLAAALALRFAALDHLPLTETESARAFAAWLVSQGSVPGDWPGDATAALTSHLFRIFGSSDTAARIIPALGGSALVASFWFAGRYIGRGAALLAAALLAISPIAVFTSRSALAFALGGFLSMAMILALLSYVREPRPLAAAALATAFGLALGSDPVAASTAAALVVFVAVEATWRSGGAVAQAVATFRSTADHWHPAALALTVTLLLGVAQFGTDIDRLSLAGLRQWADMFGLPRDHLPWHYQLSVLLWYEWPLLLAGAAAYLATVHRWLLRSETPSLVRRLLVVWATVAIIVVAFATRREAGQTLLLLLPFSLLAAMLIEETVSQITWSPLRRWWPAVAVALALSAYAVLQLSRWAFQNNGVSSAEWTYLLLALAGAAAILAVAFNVLGRDGLALAVPIAAVLALSFLVHSSLSLGFRDGAESAAGTRAGPGIEPLRAAVAQAAAETGLPVVIDPRFRDALGWYLRDSPIAFGDRTEGSAAVTAADAPAPPGLTPMGAPWRIAEGWVLEDFAQLDTWRWFAYRRPYGNLSTTDVQLLVPAQ